jgi:hypothetical protein
VLVGFLPVLGTPNPLNVNFRPEWGHRFSAKMVHSRERHNGNSWE